MNTRRVRLVGVSLLLLVLSALPALAANVRIVRLSLAQGDVQIDRNVGEGWEQAIVNMPVIGGARIYAAEQSKVELEFEDGSSVRLAGPAQITIQQLSYNAKGAPVTAIQVNSGQVYVDARLAHRGEFRIMDAENTGFTITKPSQLRFTVDQQTASLAMTNGEAVAQGSDAKVLAGKTYNYVLGQPGSAATLGSVPADSEDAWNQKRETYNDQYAATGAQFSGSDDQAAYGNADLGNYGNYSEVPGYGVMWQPNGVDPDWNPYDNGAWSYYPDWGWTFVSGYPWGWAPFYYGNWCYIGGRGWWWRPGPWHGRGPGHGNSGFHAQPLYSGHPGGKWSAPHPPSASAGHSTVAVAGSHLQVGPIGGTHEPVASNGRTVGTVGANGFRAGAPAGGPAGRVGVSSNLVRGSVVVGQKGSYALANGVHTEYNGHEVNRPAGSTVTHGYQSVGGGARAYSGPPAGMPRAPSTPVSGGTVTHMSMTRGESAPAHSSGGGGGGHMGGGGGGHAGGGGGGGGGHR